MAEIYRNVAILPLDPRRRRWHADRMNAEILIFDGFDELDALGPFEILADVAKQRDDVTARLVTLAGARPVPASHGAVVGAQGALSERPDVVIVPGGGWIDGADAGVRAEIERGAIARALAERHARGTVVASVCTGALLLAAAGVLDGRRATTNPGALDDLRAHPAIDVVAARVVDAGDVLTAGAPACGIDLALALLERHGGSGLAAAAARELQYERPAVTAPAPPAGAAAVS
jgi:transcriptional regulator GlxA family with amidase domain